MQYFCKYLLAAAIAATVSISALADMNDEPVLYSVNAEQLEWRRESGDGAIGWDVSAWAGTTRNRFLLRTEGEVNDSETEDFETQLLYSRAVTPFWNVNAGWRRDWQPAERRNWAALELDGLAPGFVETRLSLLAGSGGRTAARLKLETEWRVGSHLRLVPRLEADWYGKDDFPNEIAAGLARLEAGLRLGLVVRPDFVPYVGVLWNGLLGDTGQLARAAGSPRRSTEMVAGVSFWF